MVELPFWPAELPQYPLVSSYEEQKRSLTVAVTSGNKSTLSRKVATRSQTPIRVGFLFTKEQMSIFETFYEVTLDGGSMRFTFIHPRKEDLIEVTFDPTQQQAYTAKPSGSKNYWQVNAQFLIWD